MQAAVPCHGETGGAGGARGFQAQQVGVQGLFPERGVVDGSHRVFIRLSSWLVSNVFGVFGVFGVSNVFGVFSLLVGAWRAATPGQGVGREGWGAARALDVSLDGATHLFLPFPEFCDVFFRERLDVEGFEGLNVHV